MCFDFLEMSEFSTNGSSHHRGQGANNGNGTYNKNGGLKAVTPPQYAYGNGGYPQAASGGNQVVPKVNPISQVSLTSVDFINLVD